MPLQPAMKLLSVDDHLIEPPVSGRTRCRKSTRIRVPALSTSFARVLRRSAMGLRGSSLSEHRAERGSG